MSFGLAKAQQNRFGVRLFSRLALQHAGIHQLTGSRTPSVFAAVTLPSGTSVQLCAIHPRPPQVGQNTAERDAT